MNKRKICVGCNAYKTEYYFRDFEIKYELPKIGKVWEDECYITKVKEIKEVNIDNENECGYVYNDYAYNYNYYDIVYEEIDIEDKETDEYHVYVCIKKEGED